MSARLSALAFIIITFGALTAAALLDVGYFGVFKPHFQTWGGAQVLADLAIMGIITCTWMVPDARKSAINPWPFVAITAVLGSFGPLFYLAFRELKTKQLSPQNT